MDTHTLCVNAFKAIFPNQKPEQFEYTLTYSHAFSHYNGNIRYHPKKRHIHIRLSAQWKDVDYAIQEGIIQTLLIKALPIQPQSTGNQTLYDTFIRHAHKGITKHQTDPILRESFDRVNHHYCNDTIEITNLIWGKHSTRQLGRYTYGNDTITISSIFNRQPLPTRLVDFVMYHEMLHKRHKYYRATDGSHRHHTTAFRNDEKRFERFETIEQELQQYIRSISRWRRP